MIHTHIKPTLAIYGIQDRNKYPISGHTHDHNLTLMENGKVLAYLHLERYTQRKYDNRLSEFIEEILDTYFPDLEDFDLVNVNSFVGNSFISKHGRLRIDAPYNKDLLVEPQKVYGYFQKTLANGQEISTWNVSQELAHIYSCIPFFGDFKENSLLIHFDGGASVSNFSAFHYKEAKLHFIEAHWELSYLSKFFNDNALSFSILGASQNEHNSVPGKLMGLAGLGDYKEEIEIWLKQNEYFREYWDKPNEILNSIEKNFSLKLKDFDTKEKFFQNVAATFQEIFTRDFLNKLESLQEIYQAEYLYYSGGCALSIVTNTKILESGLFKDIFIPPCPNDSGLSLGACALIEKQKGHSISIHPPYLNNLALNVNQISISTETIEQTVNLLLKGKIIGICNGFGEIGPRALGNRSILALPNSKELAKIISQEKKGREWYRPIAPVMLKENAQKVTSSKIHHLSKYMLLDYKIKREHQIHLEGVIHANGTSRIQVIESYEENPFLFQLLKELEKKGILGLINTSFNAKGKPIVHTEKDAFESARAMNLNAIVINNNLFILES